MMLALARNRHSQWTQRIPAPWLLLLLLFTSHEDLKKIVYKQAYMPNVSGNSCSMPAKQLVYNLYLLSKIYVCKKLNRGPFLPNTLNEIHLSLIGGNYHIIRVLIKYLDYLNYFKIILTRILKFCEYLWLLTLCLNHVSPLFLSI